ncbi:MAG: tagaturonate epimerase family protein [bacterium]
MNQRKTQQMKLEKYSMGVGDRFGRQGRAQLQAMQVMRAAGVPVVPVWNKSFREHSIIHTQPMDVRRAADAAVAAEKWTGGYHVDADHISLKNVDGFVAASDFFTLDVADHIGVAAPEADVAAFVARHGDLVGSHMIAGMDRPLEVTAASLAASARKYLHAVREAGRLYRHIAERKGAGNFITEVSMDETNLPQTPPEMLVILAAIADEKIPAQTIAPKFTGRFNKGVDYVGDVAVFAGEFAADVCVIRHAIKRFGLPENLKLSVHSGSDKFSLYAPIAEAIRRLDAGVHLKTAGTTWLEEMIGLAEAGGEGLAVARDVYRLAFGRFDELCGPYATVIDVQVARLPTVETVLQWDGPRFARALRHVPSCPDFNPDFRQFIHVGYKVAAEMGPRYLSALAAHEAVVARNVRDNILERHLKPLFA